MVLVRFQHCPHRSTELVDGPRRNADQQIVGQVVEHYCGTISAFDAGCRCEDCNFAHELFVVMDEADDEQKMVYWEKRIFATPMRSAKRPFPARDLLLVAKQVVPRVLKEEMHLSERTLTSWIKDGVCLTEWEADRFACRLGVHPAHVWGELWFATVTPDDEMV